MRRIGDLLKDLGFNPEAPAGPQEAFIRHLIRAAEDHVKARPACADESQTPQLSFDAEILGVQPIDPSRVRRRSR